jgi:hypothetical protein
MPNETDDVEAMQERLDDVGDDIEAARRSAADDHLIEDDDPKYHESGDIRPDLDDQTITPPG